MTGSTDTFRDLHERSGTFVMPNPWDAETARILAALGFEALATTSAGLAHSLGRLDGVRAVSRDEALAHVAAIAAASPLPVNADLERGFGDPPEHAARAVRLAAVAGAAGGSIEDATGAGDDPIYPFDLAVARVEAAVAAARESGFVLTARSENFLHGRPDLGDTIRRLQAFEAAGADVLYAPGLPDLDAISAVCASLERPVNALADPRYSVAQLAGAGVTRISLGSRLSRAAMGAFIAAVTEVAEHGTFTFATTGAELDRLLER